MPACLPACLPVLDRVLAVRLPGKLHIDRPCVLGHLPRRLVHRARRRLCRRQRRDRGGDGTRDIRAPDSFRRLLCAHGADSGVAALESVALRHQVHAKSDPHS